MNSFPSSPAEKPLLITPSLPSAAAVKPTPISHAPALALSDLGGIFGPPAPLGKFYSLSAFIRSTRAIARSEPRHSLAGPPRASGRPPPECGSNLCVSFPTTPQQKKPSLAMVFPNFLPPQLCQPPLLPPFGNRRRNRIGEFYARKEGEDWLFPLPPPRPPPPSSNQEDLLPEVSALLPAQRPPDPRPIVSPSSSPRPTISPNPKSQLFQPFFSCPEFHQRVKFSVKKNWVQMGDFNLKSRGITTYSI